MNYRKIYAMKKVREDQIKSVCPTISRRSGIYAFYRIDENGIRHMYVGQAVCLIERCAAHLAEYDHIALSLKKHKFYSEDNPYGYKLQVKECPKDKLDEEEIKNIKHYANMGFQMLNVSLGGQGKGKQQLNEYKQPKTYRQGIEQGKKNCSKEISTLFEKYLKVSTKDEIPNRYQQNALEKFDVFLNYHKRENPNQEEENN